MRNLFTLAIALMLTTSLAMAQDHTATHTVTGNNSSGNEATIVQAGNQQTATVQQQGTDNSVESLQDRPGQTSNHENVFTANQNGIENVIESRQAGARNLSVANQIGARNEIAVEDGGYGLDITGANHKTYIDQVGDDNRSTVRTGGSTHNLTNIRQGEEGRESFSGDVRVRLDGHRNKTNVDQYGQENDAGVNVIGDDNFVDVLQDGDYNVADIGGGSYGEYGVNIRGDGNDIDVVQSGNQNIAYVRVGQMSGAANRAHNNTVDITQFGDANTADVQIQGQNNLSVVCQNAGPGCAYTSP